MKKYFNFIKKKSINSEVIEFIPESLKKLVGKEIIRMAPTANGDWSYTDEPVLLKGFSVDNNMMIQYIKEYTVFSISQFDELPIYFTDNKWILLEDATKSEDNELNKFINKKIKRIRPVTKFSDRLPLFGNVYKEDHSYMCEYGEIPPMLVSASKYHIVVKNYNNMGNENIIMGPRYSNPKDWVEAI